MADKAFQDYYADEFAHCYGCGRLNEAGLQIKSNWEGEESVCRFVPKPYHSGGFPGYFYGGLISSLIDCHSAATASAHKLRSEGFALGEKPLVRFVTASLKVDFLKPTPIGVVIDLRSRVLEIRHRKIIVSTELSAEGELRARGEAVMVLLPESGRK